MISCYSIVGFVVFVASIANFEALVVPEISDPSKDTICGEGNSNSNETGYPWTVAIYKNDEIQDEFLCAGNLISTKTVITAAHCIHPKYVKSSKPEDLTAVLGGNDLTDSKNIKKIGVEKIIIHPDYSLENNNYDADLALLQLEDPLDFKTIPTIKPICLWQGTYETSEIEGTSGLLTGIDRDKLVKKQNIPMLAKAEIQSQLTCLRSNTIYLKITSNRTLCVDVLEKSIKSKIFSGNGVMVKSDNNKWTLVGITVASVAELDTNVICVEVARFKEWIQANMV